MNLKEEKKRFEPNLIYLALIKFELCCNGWVGPTISLNWTKIRTRDRLQIDRAASTFVH